MRKVLMFMLMFLFSAALAFSQSHEVSGTVMGVDGDPLQGITVQVQGSTTATATDENGKYKIEVPQNGVLVFSGVGFTTQTVNVGDRTSVNVALVVETTALNEVVVTALGISREKRSLGYATQAVRGEELVQAANTDFATALQGKVSGLEVTPSSGMPGASALITIRGARSFTGNNAPLYVVDGMPISSNADISTEVNDGVAGTDYANRSIDIDPNDIASIDVLKGQAAAALYGIRASNGVIVITTKSGRAAGGLNKPHVSFTTNASFDNLSRYPKLQSTYAQGSSGTYGPTASQSFGPKIEDLPDDAKYGGNTQNDFTDALGMHPGQYYVPQRASAGLDPWATPGVHDNIRDFFQLGTLFNNNISVGNANESGSYSFSLGSTNQRGIIPQTGMERYNARLAAETRLSNHFKTEFHGFFTSSDIDKAPSANDGIVATVYPAPVSYDLKGIPDHQEGDIYVPVGYRGGSFVNPYWGMEHNKFTESTNRFYGNTSLTYSTKFSDVTSLNVKYQIGVDAYTTNFRDLWSYGSPARNSSVEDYSWTNNSLNSLLTATFDWDVSSDLHFNALLGNEIVNNRTKHIDAFGQNIAFPGWNHMDNTGTKDATEEDKRSRTFGNFASLSLSYQRMLYLTLTGREDRISTMPRDSRDFFYPSASLGFVFTELGNLGDGSFLNYGKLRLSVAQVGQAGDYLPNYYVKPSYLGGFYSFAPILYPIGSINGYAPSVTVYDPNLKPQNTTSYEIGADFTLFNNRVDLSYTFSRQNVKDQIFKVPLAGSTGSSEFMTNGGSIHTNAHEVSLNVRVVNNKDFSWSIGGNFSKIDNYVDALAPGVESIFLGGFETPQVRAGIGDKFPVIYGTTYERDDEGHVVVDEDGFPIAGAPGVIGRVAPDFILGANTRLKYKMFTLTAVTDWKSGGQMYGGTTGLMDLYGTSLTSAEARDNGSVIFPNAVLQNGEHNDIAVSGYGVLDGFPAYYTAINNIDESSIINSSFLKLRELSLRIDAMKRADFGLSFNVFARNILLWTNSPIFDPEASQGNDNMSGAFERFSLPATRSFGAGINVQF